MARTQRPRPAARRLGYLLTIGIDALVWYLVNVRPGWESVPFLTDGVEQVLGLFNLSLLVSAIANVLYLVYDPPRFRALGDLVAAVVSLVLAIRAYEVFPVDFTGLAYDLTTLARVVMILGIVGSVLAVLAALVALVRGRRD
jgi:hypothetical protein